MPIFQPRVLLFLPILLTASCSHWGESKTPFKTAKIIRADIVPTIEATGTLEPEDVVDIGARVTGQILSFGNDAKGRVLDYGSQVEAGQVLAKIDDVPYALSRQQAEAQLNRAQSDVLAASARLVQAKAGVGQETARVAQAVAQQSQAQKDWDRAQKVGTASAVMTQADFDRFQGAFEAAVAGVKAAKAAHEVAEAQVIAADAGVAQAQSAVAEAKVAIALADRNLGYCTITSPVKGIIIDRRVDVGQTVVSNLNASSLFLLAKDLTKMQVWAPVNEADIGRIHVGQPVRFSVDAFPGRSFQGAVDKVRLNAAMTQNIVTYTVEITADNADGLLLPYLTANVKFEVDRKTAVLAVPNAALRWQPDEAQVAPGTEALPGVGEDAHKGARKDANQGAGKIRTGGSSRLWVVAGERGEFVRPIRVHAGISDGVMTEVELVAQGATLENMEVVIGQERPESAPEKTESSSPFAPKFPGKKK